MRIKVSNVALFVGLAIATSCGGDTSPDNGSAEVGNETAATQSPGIRLVDAPAAAELLDDPPADLVVLDVRTAEEFASGHLDGAVMLDFHSPTFADDLATLDPDVPYLMYCRSGNRSGQTRAIMEQLGFTDVADVDGGILSWADSGLPVVSP